MNTRILLVAVSIGALLLLLAACEDAPSRIPSPTPDGAVVDTGPVGSTKSDTGGVALEPTPTPEPVIFSRAHSPPFYNAASPSVEKRIYDSDVVVRAALQSPMDGRLVFRAIEYLKGTGPTELIVNADTAGRNTGWDSREAVLFLSRPQQLAPGASGAEFEFTNSHYKNPEGYTIDTLDPAWLPAGATGTDGASNGNPDFVTDSGSVAGISYQTISLAELRSKVEWMEGGEKTDDSEAYDICIRKVMQYKKFHRDWEAYYGKPRPTPQTHEQITSGTGEGTVISDYGSNSGSGYDRYWLTGQDADLFRYRRTDNDEDPTNGYNEDFVTERPLPDGAYKFSLHGQSYGYTPCNFMPKDGARLSYWTISVVMPEDALHEALFDPVTVGKAVAAGGPNGVLEPAAFTDSNSASATIRRIAWEAGTVKLTLSPHNGISDRTVDFIALDGSVALSLAVADATVDAVTETLTWKVESQPWQSGDKLMLRIH